MTTDVNRIQGTYRLQNVNNSGVVSDIFVVDTTSSLSIGAGYAIPAVPTTSKVVITGDLVVLGTRTELSSTNITITDPTILLNQGGNFTPSSYLSGLQTSVDATDNVDLSYYMQYNNTASWTGTGPLGVVRGVFEFRKGLPTSPNPLYSAIKINAIRMPRWDVGTSSQPEGGYSTVGLLSSPRLNIFGSDNPTSVMSVKGTTNYEDNCTDPDDIPNVQYVLNSLATNINHAESVVVGNSYFTINDKVENSAGFSQLLGVLDGNPSVKPNPSTGTVVLIIKTSTALISGIQFNANQISPVQTNTNLVLSATGVGQIIASSPILYQASVKPVPGAGQTGLYSQNPGSGGTGIYFVNSSTGGVVTQDEFISRKKALVFSLIF